MDDFSIHGNTTERLEALIEHYQIDIRTDRVKKIDCPLEVLLKHYQIDERTYRAHVRSTERSAPFEESYVSLGTNYEICVPSEKIGVINRFFLQEIARETLPDQRIKVCFRHLIPGTNDVKILHNQKYKKAHYGNLMVCGSIWLCAVCASKISERRKKELVQAVENHQGGLAMVSFTMRHSVGDSLKDNLDILTKSYRSVTSGRWYQNLKTRFKIIGSVSNLEITYGDNGWHPHKHVLLFFKYDVTEKTIEELRKQLTEVYLKSLWKNGGFGLDRVAVDVQEAKTEKQKYAEYMAKFDKNPSKNVWGVEAEMTKSHVKAVAQGGKSYWELLKEFSLTGEYKYLLLIREYAKVIKGKQSLVYSKGLRKLLNLGQQQTDLEIAEEQDEEAILLATIAKDIWQAVTKAGLRGQLLEVSNDGDLSQIESFLRRFYGSKVK